MSHKIDAITERFDQALITTMQNLGPKLIHRVRLGLTPSQVFMLRFIQKEKQCSLSSLADKMEVSASAGTVMLDRLENHGLVVRTRDKNDRRVVITQLTPEGEHALNDVLKIRKKMVQHCLAQFEPDELTPFVQTLEKLAAISAEMDVQAVIGSGKDLEG